MCGLTAISAVENKCLEPDRLEQQIEESLDLVDNRGPDARGQWISPDRRVALGHNRLSTVDPTPDGNQPFHDGDNDVHVIVNGELYNDKHVRAKLATEYNFQSNSDCEIVLALYKHYGMSFLSHLDGEFALILWDAKREQLVAVRDRYGVKSLYYTFVNGRLLIATETKSFLAFGWKPEWCVRSLRENGWRYDSRTFFKGVKKVLPGHSLTCRLFGEVEQKPYWDLNFPDKHVPETRSEEELILGVRERLLEAVRRRLQADAGVGIYLSGGLDSSAIAGMAAHLVTEGKAKMGNDGSGHVSLIKCFTVQFDKNSSTDESHTARRTADWLGVECNTVCMDEDAITAKFRDISWHSESSAPDVNATGKIAMAEMAHSMGLKVVLTGEGSDEHFGGYTHFEIDALLEPDHTWPQAGISDEERLTALEASRKAANVLDWAGADVDPPTSTKRMLNNVNIGKQLTSMSPLLFAPWMERYADTNQQTVIAESIDGKARQNIQESWHTLHSAMYIWSKTAFANFVLRYEGENIDMAHQVVSRTPYLDHHLTSYVTHIPPSLKVKYDPRTKQCREKHILREAVRPFITDEIYNRKKHAYLGPVKYPENGPFHNLMKEILTEENVEQLGFADWTKTKGLLTKAFVDKDRSAFRHVVSLAHFVNLSKQFGVKKAECRGVNGVAHINGTKVQNGVKVNGVNKANGVNGVNGVVHSNGAKTENGVTPLDRLTGSTESVSTARAEGASLDGV